MRVESSPCVDSDVGVRHDVIVETSPRVDSGVGVRSEVDSSVGEKSAVDQVAHDLPFVEWCADTDDSSVPLVDGSGSLTNSHAHLREEEAECLTPGFDKLECEVNAVKGPSAKPFHVGKKPRVYEINRFHADVGHFSESVLRLLAEKEGIQLTGELRPCTACLLAHGRRANFRSGELPPAGEPDLIIGVDTRVSTPGRGAKRPPAPVTVGSVENARRRRLVVGVRVMKPSDRF